MAYPPPPGAGPALPPPPGPAGLALPAVSGLLGGRLPGGPPFPSVVGGAGGVPPASVPPAGKFGLPFSTMPSLAGLAPRPDSQPPSAGLGAPLPPIPALPTRPPVLDALITPPSGPALTASTPEKAAANGSDRRAFPSPAGLPNGTGRHSPSSPQAWTTPGANGPGPSGNGGLSFLSCGVTPSPVDSTGYSLPSSGPEAGAAAVQAAVLQSRLAAAEQQLGQREATVAELQQRLAAADRAAAEAAELRRKLAEAEQQCSHLQGELAQSRMSTTASNAHVRALERTNEKLLEQNATMSANIEKVMERLNDVLMEREEVANEFRRYKAAGHLAQVGRLVEPLVQAMADGTNGSTTELLDRVKQTVFSGVEDAPEHDPDNLPYLMEEDCIVMRRRQASNGPAAALAPAPANTITPRSSVGDAASMEQPREVHWAGLWGAFKDKVFPPPGE